MPQRSAMSDIDSSGGGVSDVEHWGATPPGIVAGDALAPVRTDVVRVG